MDIPNPTDRTRNTQVVTRSRHIEPDTSRRINRIRGGKPGLYLVCDGRVGLAVVAVDGAHGGRLRLGLPPEAGASAAEPCRPGRLRASGLRRPRPRRRLAAQPCSGHPHHLLYPRAHPALCGARPSAGGTRGRSRETSQWTTREIGGQIWPDLRGLFCGFRVSR